MCWRARGSPFEFSSAFYRLINLFCYWILFRQIFIIFHYFLLQDELKNQKSNEDHTLLRKITKRLISTQEELLDFGLHLGFGRDDIVQMLTSNPGSVESAGWGLACEWWKVGNESPAKRFEILCESAEAIGKHHLKETVREMIRDKVAQSDEMEEVPQDSPSNAGMGTRLKQSDRDLFCRVC